jgi:hypothetical protein
MRTCGPDEQAALEMLRTGSGPGPGNDVHGSTMFFIYVIGASPFSLFCFCAERSPCRLLLTESPALDRDGPARLVRGACEAAGCQASETPTASEEDIDNSGLEVIRSGVLTEYEKVGRIAPMCVDRVRLPFCCFKVFMLSVDSA